MTARSLPRARPSRRWAAVVATLLVALGALLVSALLEQRPLPSPGVPGAGRVAGTGPVGAPPVPGRALGPRVAYTGPRGRVSGPVELRARVRRAGARVVAVTFLVDGRPAGTDTTPPYRLEAGPPALTTGVHRVWAQAIDRLGRRTSSRSWRLEVTPGAPRDELVTGPGAGFDRALAALARGHAAVRLAPGRYPVRQLRLGDGARLSGSGAATVLTATAGAWALVHAQGSDIGLTDLALDGRGRVGRAIAVAGGSARVRVQRVAIRGVQENGVEVWGEHADVSVQDSTISGGGARGTGVFELGSDRSRDMSVVRTEIRGFRSYGIDFAQRFYRRPAAALHNLALDNRIADITDPATASGRTEGGIWSGGVAAAIIGNRVRDTGWDGIQTVGSSRGTTIVANDIARTRTGIYIEHETTRSLIAGNTIAGVITGINAEWRYGGHGSSQNTYTRNRIVAPSQTGLFIDVSGDRNRIVGNLVAGGGGPAIVLQGASDNEVAGNELCGDGRGPVVRQQSGHHDDGVQANSLYNRIADNTRAAACPAP
jgi:Periplasmic copper-binding protein (NosD)/Bacterial Ig domain